MKKIYIKPEIATYVFETVGMLALSNSLPETGKDNVEVGAPGFYDEDEDWDDEDMTTRKRPSAR